MHKAIVDAPNLTSRAMNTHLGSHPRGSTVAAYSKRYAEAADSSDEMAAHLHKSYDYSGAANQLDRGTGEYSSMHQMVSYNLGAEHPASKALGDMVSSRHDLASSYRQTVGLHKEDTDTRFDEIMKNTNLGKQFE